MTKSNITDEQIFALIDEGKKNAEIARHFGVSQPSINARINKLRTKHEFNLAEGKKKVERIPEVRQTEATEPIKTFPFARQEPVIFGGIMHTVSHVGPTRMILHRNSDLKSITILADDYIEGRANVRKVEEKKPMPIKISGTRFDDIPYTCKEKIAEKLKSDAKQFEGERAIEIENAAEEILKSQKDQIADQAEHFGEVDCSEEAWNVLSEAYAKKTVFEKVAEKAKKPAIVNQAFEDLFKPIDKVVHEYTVKEQRQCVHFLKDCDHPLIDNCEDCQDFKDATEIAEASDKVEPFNLDLEMDDNTDQYIDEPTDCPKPRFEPIDYTDSDWFAIPAQNTVEYRIWMETMRKIQEINEARDVVRKALDVGDRLPATEVERYNKIVSKYQEEVGA